MEPVATDQLALFAGAAPIEAPAIAVPVTRPSSGDGGPPARVSRKPVRQVLPSHSPRETVVIKRDVDTSVLKKIGVEVTETLDYCRRRP